MANVGHVIPITGITGIANYCIYQYYTKNPDNVQYLILC